LKDADRFRTAVAPKTHNADAHGQRRIIIHPSE
jgi:hypothetical protein